MAERGLQVLRKLRFTCKAVFSVADIAENTLAKQGSRFSGPPLQCCASRHLKVFGFKGSSQSPSHSRSVATASSATRTRISSRKDNNEVQDQPPNFKLRPSSGPELWEQDEKAFVDTLTKAVGKRSQQNSMEEAMKMSDLSLLMVYPEKAELKTIYREPLAWEPGSSSSSERGQSH